MLLILFISIEKKEKEIKKLGEKAKHCFTCHLSLLLFTAIKEKSKLKKLKSVTVGYSVLYIEPNPRVKLKVLKDH